MAKIETFAAAYAAMESALRAVGSSTQELDETLSDDDKDRLRLCRITRNYLAHHDDGAKFAAASDEEVAFLERLTAAAKAKVATAKDALKKTKPIGPTTSGLEALALLKKEPFVPIVDEDGRFVGVADAAAAARAISKTKSLDAPFVDGLTKKELRESFEKTRTFRIDEPLDPKAAVDPAIVLKKDGKYAGVVDWLG